MTTSPPLRDVMGTFATGVTVVTYPSDPPHGITVNALTSVSLDPPLILVCIDHDTKSYELLSEGTDAFAVTVLSADQLHLGEYFADMTELPESPFEAEVTTTAESGAPIFADGLGYLDCDVWEAVPAGDHTIYIGEVQAGEVLDEDGPALTFHRGRWGSTE